jgi:hypothetical protein
MNKKRILALRDRTASESDEGQKEKNDWRPKEPKMNGGTGTSRGNGTKTKEASTIATKRKKKEKEERPEPRDQLKEVLALVFGAAAPNHQ